jgi:hypothetical protein
MPGIIMIKASSYEVQQTANAFARLLDFLTNLPLLRSFAAETKCIVAQDAVIMRGRDSLTRELKTLHVRAGITTIRQVRAFFHY